MVHDDPYIPRAYDGRGQYHRQSAGAATDAAARVRRVDCIACSLQREVRCYAMTWHTEENQ